MRALDLSLPQKKSTPSDVGWAFSSTIIPRSDNNRTHRRIGKEGTIDTRPMAEMFFLPEPRRHA